MKYFDEIFQLCVLATLIAYVFFIGGQENVNLIIGALIGVLSGAPKLKKEYREKEQQ